MTGQRLKVKGQRFLNCLIVTFSFLFLLYSPAFAAAEEGGHEAGSAILWRIVNFAILALSIFLVAKYLNVKGFFISRREAIRTALEEARKTKEEADKKVKEFELKLSLLDKKTEEIYQEIIAEGEAEKEKIIEEATQAAVKIKEQARFAVEQEIKKAKEELQGEIARVAVEMAEEILRNELTAADHERLIKEYLEKVKVH